MKNAQETEFSSFESFQILMNRLQKTLGRTVEVAQIMIQTCQNWKSFRKILTEPLVRHHKTLKVNFICTIFIDVHRYFSRIHTLLLCISFLRKTSTQNSCKFLLHSFHTCARSNSFHEMTLNMCSRKWRLIADFGIWETVIGTTQPPPRDGAWNA